MPAIVFDCLVPAEHFDALTRLFQALAERVSEVEGADLKVTATSDVTLDPQVEQQLRELAPGEPTRFTIDIAEGVKSLNQTAMLFSRLLTPQTDLPAEPVALHNEQAFEVDAYFPWTVTIQP